MEKTHNTLIFCVALNGYDRLYQRCIDSQQLYAKQQGYQYQLIKHPETVSITASAWVKIPLLIDALKKGYEWVAFIDADCQIKAHTPALQSLTQPNKSLYMANGFSDHINSGVIITKQDPQLLALLQQIYDNCHQRVPASDWGENGHLIHFAENWSGLYKLDRRWNNNTDPELNDFIRHYSAGGPMRRTYPKGIMDFIWRGIYKLKNLFNRKKYLPQLETRKATDELRLTLERSS